MAADVCPYRNDEADWWRVRDLLVRVQGRSSGGWGWEVRRWDGLRFHRAQPVLPDGIARRIGLWEDGSGRLVGVVHPEDEGAAEAYLELDPDERDLEPAMLDWAEAHLARVIDGSRSLDLVVLDGDAQRRTLLESRGYRMLEHGTWHRRLVLEGMAAPAVSLPAPYVLGTTAAATAARDAERMASLLNAAFGRTIHTPAEYTTFMARSPSFRHDLNLVALAADGSFAAHAGVTLDDVNLHGIFEPVCTHPDHLRHGLARSLMLEGLRRLRDLGAISASVETGDMEPANALYAGIGFTETHRAHAWRREWRAAVRAGARD